MAFTTAHRREQRTNLLKMFNNEELCDVTFIVGEERKEIKTHRLLLASISPVFKAMLYGNMIESKLHSKIEIVDINPTAFEAVLQYAYCNDPHLSPNNIIPIRYISEKYQISLISKLCDEYFKSFISPQNVCSLLNGAVNIKLEIYIKYIQETLLSSIGSNASEIVKSDGFLEMNQNAMKILLESDGLNIKEETLWEYLLKWERNRKDDAFDGSAPPNKKQKVNEKVKNKSDLLLKPLYPLIRFSLMDPTYFAEKVVSANILSSDECVIIFQYFCNANNNNQKCGNFAAKPRHRRYEKSSIVHDLIPYSLGFSMDTDEIFGAQYDTLINCDLTKGCGIEERSNEPWITATFNTIMNVIKVEIGVLKSEDWDSSDIDGSYLQYMENDEWKDLQIIGLQQDVVTQFNVNRNISTPALRLIRKNVEKCFIGVGCWRIYGFQKHD